MANYATLKAAISAAIKQNGNNEITGNLLQQQLLAMVNSLGIGYQYAGIATPATNPGTPDQNVCYLALTVGAYANFDGISILDGEIAILKYNGEWTKDAIPMVRKSTIDGIALKLGLTREYSVVGGGATRSFEVELYSGESYGITTNNGVNIYGIKTDGTTENIGLTTANVEMVFVAASNYVGLSFYTSADTSVQIRCVTSLETTKADRKDITGIIDGAYLDNKGNWITNKDWFISPFVRLNGATTIIWNYITYNINGKLCVYDENKNFIEFYNPVSGSQRTLDLSGVENAVYVRASFLVSNAESVTITDGDGNILWRAQDQNMTDAAAENKEKISAHTIGNLNVLLTPYSNSRRLNPDGSAVSYAGYTCSRSLRVNLGDIVHYRGCYTGYMGFAAGYSGRAFTGVTETFTGTPFNGIQDIYFVISNPNTKYVNLCTLDGTDDVYKNQFAVEIIPHDGFLFENVKKSVLQNNFPGALSKAPNFVSKYLSGDDVQICLLGDSITQISNQTPNQNPESLPPFMEHKNWCYWLWSFLNKNDNMICRRNDYPGFFTLHGNWTGPDDSDNSFNNAYSADGDAYLTFLWNLNAYEKTNLVIPIISNISASTKIAILYNGVETNGMVEYYDNTTKQWIEANGLLMSFLRLSGASGSQLNCQNNRYKFRRKSGAVGNITFKVYKSIADTDRLVFWGVEQWNGQGVFISNAAYGGFATYELQPGNISNIRDRYPDLVLFEMTLVNNLGDRINSENSKTLMQNDFWDYIWGDRSGNANPLSLKAISNNWQNFELLCVVPHWRKQWVDGDLFRSVVGGVQVPATALECYNVVKALFVNKDDVNVIDMGAALKWEAHKRGWTLEQSYDGDESGSDITGQQTFTQDTVHLNDLGGMLYGMYIAPIFDF